MAKPHEILKAIALGLLPAAALAAPVAASERLSVVRYTVPTEKLTRPVRLALLSDLHSCYYGPWQHQIMEALDLQRPDAVMLAGDIADDTRRHHNTFVLLRQLGQRCPTFYVSGNHEVWTCHLERLKKVFTAYGVIVLEGSCRRLTVRGQSMLVCGVDDPCAGNKLHARQAITAAKKIRPEEFSLLLAHRPEYGPWYAEKGYDLVLTGHAHGGQWRLPGVCNGLFVTDQGFFPKYAGGEYHFEREGPYGPSTMVISRGLARESTPIPRIFNRPEVVIVDLLPR